MPQCPLCFEGDCQGWEVGQVGSLLEWWGLMSSRVRRLEKYLRVTAQANNSTITPKTFSSRLTVPVLDTET